MQGASPFDPDEKARRVRSLLSSYYGTGDKGGGDASPGGAEGADAGGGINSATFDAERFTRQLVRGTRLDGLLGKHVEMSQEIKSLEGDMQNLVYENYSKFISATDTIRSMKSNVEGMGARMEELMDTVSGISARSDAINDKLSSRRHRIEELSSVRSVLKKMQVVFDLPEKLRAAQEHDALEVGVKYYHDVAPFLAKYGTKGSFTKVKREVDAEVTKISTRLKEQLQREETTSDQAGDFIQLLGMIGQDVASLQGEFMRAREGRLREMIGAVEGALPPPTPSGGGAEQSPSPPPAPAFPTPEAFVLRLHHEFIPEVEAAVAACNELFPAGRGALLSMIRPVAAEYFRVARAGLAPVGGGGGAPPPSPGDLIRALELLAGGAARLHEVLPEAHLPDRAAEVVEKAVRHHVGTTFWRLEMEVMQCVHDGWDRIALAGGERGGAGGAAGGGAAITPGGVTLSGQPLLMGFVTGTEVIAEGVREALSSLGTLLKGAPALLEGWRDVFVDLVLGQFQQLLMTLVENFQAIAGITSSSRVPSKVPTSEAAYLTPVKGRAAAAGAMEAGGGGVRGPAPAGLVLLLSRLCSHMESTVVPYVVEGAGRAFPGAGAGGGAAQPPAFVAGQIARKLRAAGEALLAAYTEASGRRLSLLVRKSMASANWASYKEPRDVRMVCDLVLQELHSMEGEVTQLLDDGGRRAASGGAPSSPGAGGGAGGGVKSPSTRAASEVAKMFQSKLEIFGAVEGTQASVLAGVVKIFLKSWVESVRQVTLGRAGYQQMQLDVHYMRPLLRPYAGEDAARVAEPLLDEVLGAAQERSLDPTPLEPAIIEMILSKRGDA